MRRLLLSALALALTVWAANQKLYMTDGTYQLVREYKVQGDRIRFYSIERSGWEEVPKELVDLPRTEKEFKERQTQLEKEAKVFGEEEKVARDLEKEVMRIPQNPGVYWLEGEKANKLKAAETTVKTSKGRSILGRMTPIPVVSGRGTVEIQGPHSLNVITNAEQEFYIQLSDPERFGIIRIQTKGAVRIVENLSIEPISKEMEEERDTVDIFQKQMTPDGLYKIWPKQPLPAGEYAVVEFAEGKMNMQVWDFAIKSK